ncbi:hypothetical protein BX616_004755, partial [Lobosporangium transversale]
NRIPNRDRAIVVNAFIASQLPFFLTASLLKPCNTITKYQHSMQCITHTCNKNSSMDMEHRFKNMLSIKDHSTTMCRNIHTWLLPIITATVSCLMEIHLTAIQLGLSLILIHIISHIHIMTMRHYLHIAYRTMRNRIPSKNSTNSQVMQGFIQLATIIIWYSIRVPLQRPLLDVNKIMVILQWSLTNRQYQTLN